MQPEKLYTAFPTPLLNAIREAEEIIVLGHSSPDGDCIFSQLACYEIFTYLGKSVTLANEGPFTRNEIREYESLFLGKIPQDLIDRKPLVVVVDCSTIDRPGSLILPLQGLKTVVLDHHSSGQIFTDESLMKIIPASVSTTLIVDALREELGVPLYPTLASYIYRGFVTDTGFFHFINEKNGGETLRRVSHLVDMGVSPYLVYDEMHDGKSLKAVKDLAMLIDRAKEAFDGKLLYTWQSEDEEIEGKPGEGIYAQLLEVSGVKAILFFKAKDGYVEVGMRSKNKSGIDIGAFAAEHGGGGHRYAAGAKVKGSLEAVMETLIKDISKLL